jgi:hypothetical protein
MSAKAIKLRNIFMRLILAKGKKTFLVFEIKANF